MFNRAHSIFLRQLIREAGNDPALEARELSDDIDLFYLNILPDALPFHAGLPPLRTHDSSVLEALAGADDKSGKKLLLGFKMHHLLDNLSHCGSLHDTGDYTSGFALKSGLGIKGQARPEVKEIFNRVEGKSGFYTLHSGVEMAVDLCLDEPKINQVLDQACRVFFERLDEYMPLLALIPGISGKELDRAIQGMRQRAEKIPFVKGVSLEGMTNRFVKRYMPSSNMPETLSLVREFLELARTRMCELWPPFLESAVSQVAKNEPDIIQALGQMIDGKWQQV